MTIGTHFDSYTDALFRVEPDREHGSGVRLIALPHMRQAIKRADVRFRDAQPPMNNLGGRKGSRFLPGRDQSPGSTTGTNGSATGGAPRKPERPDKPPSLRGGAFTVSDQEPEKPGTSQQYRHPSVTDQEPDDEEGLGARVGTLPPPDPGCPRGVKITQELDTGSTMTTADRTYKHTLRDRIDPILRRMNRVNANRFRDADMVRRTVYHHVIIPGERLALEENLETGGWDLVIYSKATTNMNGSVPPATGSRQREDNPGDVPPATAWSAAPGSRPGERSIHELQTMTTYRTGDRRMSEAVQLRAMNQQARQFCAR